MASRFKTIITDVGKVVAWPVNHLGQVIAGINAALKSEPAVKAAITGLLAKIDQTGADAAAAATADGLNIPADMATAAAAATLFTYIRTVFIPALEAAYHAEKTAIDGADDPPANAAAAPAPSALNGTH